MPPPGMMIDGHYPPGIALPTSATRLHQASWPPPPPWGGDGSQPPPPHMIHIGYPHPYYNTPPPYYRPDMMQPTPDLVAPQQVQNGVGSPNTGESSSSRTGSPVMANMAVGPSLAPLGMERASGTEAGEGEAAVIDPSLVSPSSSSADGKSVSMEITQLNAAERESSVSSRASGMSDAPGSSPGHGHQILSHTSGEASREGEGDVDNEETVVQDLPSSHAMSNPNLTPLERPPEMEQMLTEDGEPMLNPAELLTQESLASPPPS